MRHRLGQVALATTTIALCLVVIDRVVFWTFPLGRVVYQPDPIQLYDYIPGASKYFIHTTENGGDWVRVDINEQGFRGEAVRGHGESTRILVYGDSFVAAEYTPLEDTYPARLADDLTGLMGRPVEAINAGLVGAGPDQVARRMPAELETLEPDVVIVAITAANDFGDLVRNKLYRIGPNGELIKRFPELGPGLRRGLEPGLLSHSGWGRLIRAAWRGTPLRLREIGLTPATADTRRAPVARRLLVQNQREYQNSLVDDDPIVRNLFDDLYDADVSMQPDSISAKGKRALMGGVLAELTAIAQSAEVPLLIVVVPSPFDVIEDHFGLMVNWSRFPFYARDALTTAVSNRARDLGLPVLDLFEPMYTAPDPSALFFRSGNDHWNAQGQALAARLTAQRIAELGWVGEPSATSD